jgi:MYXO-CTERM domain-containing protein
MADPDGTGEITDGDDPKPRKKGGCGMASDGSVDLRGLALLLGMLLLLMGRRRRAL